MSNATFAPLSKAYRIASKSFERATCEIITLRILIFLETKKSICSLINVPKLVCVITTALVSFCTIAAASNTLCSFSVHTPLDVPISPMTWAPFEMSLRIILHKSSTVEVGTYSGKNGSL